MTINACWIDRDEEEAAMCYSIYFTLTRIRGRWWLVGNPESIEFMADFEFASG